MIQVSSLKYRYNQTTALAFPDFAVPGGKACLLLGSSGSGKTTLLHLMGGLLKVQEGSIIVDGQELAALSGAEMDRFRGRRIGFVFQRHHLISALTVRGNLLMAPFLANTPQDDERVDDVLAQLGLWEKKHERIRHLSQGQAQRVAIGRAIINRPAVILADEPTSALDDFNCERVIELLLKVAGQNQCTLVVATHDQRIRSVIPQEIRLDN